jgi:hypothetical protein
LEFGFGIWNLEFGMPNYYNFPSKPQNPRARWNPAGLLR